MKKMPRLLLVGLALVALALLSTGCAELEDLTTNNGKQANTAKPQKRPQPKAQQRDGPTPQRPAPTKRGTPVQLRIPGLGPQAGDPEDCVLVKRVVVFNLDVSEYPKTAAHTRAAIKRGEATILHIDRAGADANRDQSLAGIPTKDGYDRDEYPPATSYEGGAGADVAYVPYSDNRGSGSSMGAQLADYCSGQAFRYVFVP